MAHKITAVEGSLGELLNETCTSPLFPGYVRADGVVLPETYTRIVDAIDNFEVRDDDVWVCGFPKSGTTWTQEMVWCIANDVDSEGAKVPLSERFPILEQMIPRGSANVGQHDPERTDSHHDRFKFFDNLPSPRFIKSHFPFHLLPRQLRTGETKAKIVYVARNPKDTCISFFHFMKLLNGFRGSFDQWCDLFIGDTVLSAPFWGNILGYWMKRNDGNILFLKYEDMKKDLRDVMKKTATFLGKSLTSDQLSTLSEHLSFATMKANPAVNFERRIAQFQAITGSKEKGEFMRNGNVDQWKTVMSPEIIQRFDDWSSECSKGTGLHF